MKRSAWRHSGLQHERVYIIAEAGVNHNGDLQRALAMVDAAAETGADAVKFQMFVAGRLVTADAAKADYQRRNLGEFGSQFDMLLGLQLDVQAHRRLFDRCKEKGIDFLSSPFDPVCAAELNGLGMEVFKIPSGEITNLPLLRAVGRTGKPVILSTGMSDLNEVGEALDALVQAGTPRDGLVLLHCTTEYPAPVESVNLRAMAAMKNAFNLPVGYSDHTPGIEVCVAAAALGAVVLEKHFTLDRALPGPDHKASLEVDELAALVKAVRHVEAALGDGVKRIHSSEFSNRSVARKSIVAARDIACGEVLSDENLAAKRPGTGLSPMRWDEIVGRVAVRGVKRDEAINFEDLTERE